MATMNPPPPALEHPAVDDWEQGTNPTERNPLSFPQFYRRSLRSLLLLRHLSASVHHWSPDLSMRWYQRHRSLDAKARVGSFVATETSELNVYGIDTLYD